MEIKNWLVRWYMCLDENGRIDITERSYSRHMPLNRMISEAGFYSMDIITVGEYAYHYTFHNDEYLKPKSEVLLGKFKIIDDNIYMVDMEESDMRHLDLFYEKIFKTKRKIN